MKLRAPVLREPSQAHARLSRSCPFVLPEAGKPEVTAKVTGRAGGRGHRVRPGLRQPASPGPAALPPRLPSPHFQESAARRGEKGSGLLLSFLRQRLSKTEPKRFRPTLSKAASLREKSRFGGIPAPLPGKGQGALPALPSHTADALRAVSTTERKHFT